MAAKRGPKVDRERVARILVDASELGDALAAKRHNVSVRTVESYRAKYASDPNVAELCGTLKKAVVEDWLAAAKGTRRKLLKRVDALADSTDDLRTVAGALKIVHDAVLADELLNRGEQPLDGAGVGGAPRPDSPLSRTASRAVH